MSRNDALQWMILTQALCLAGLIPWLFVLLMGQTALPVVSEANWAPIFRTAVLGAPIWPAGFGLASWLAYRNGEYEAAVKWSIVASIYVLPFVAMVAFVIVANTGR